MTSRVTMSTTYDAITHGAVTRPPFHAAPSPPTTSSRSPRYMIWFARLESASSTEMTSRSGSFRMRNATNIATPWHITKTMSPTRCSATSQRYTGALHGTQGCRRPVDHRASCKPQPAVVGDGADMKRRGSPSLLPRLELPAGGLGGCGDRLPVGADDVPLATDPLAVDVAGRLVGGEVVQRHAVEGDLLRTGVRTGDGREVLRVEPGAERRRRVGRQRRPAGKALVRADRLPARPVRREDVERPALAVDQDLPELGVREADTGGAAGGGFGARRGGRRGWRRGGCGRRGRRRRGRAAPGRAGGDEDGHTERGRGEELGSHAGFLRHRAVDRDPYEGGTAAVLQAASLLRGAGRVRLGWPVDKASGGTEPAAGIRISGGRPRWRRGRPTGSPERG